MGIRRTLGRCCGDVPRLSGVVGLGCLLDAVALLLIATGEDVLLVDVGEVLLAAGEEVLLVAGGVLLLVVVGGAVLLGLAGDLAGVLDLDLLADVDLIDEEAG